MTPLKPKFISKPKSKSKPKPKFLNRTTPVRMTPARLKKIASIPDLSRHILTFDSEDPSTFSAHTLPPAAIMQAVARTPIPWPAGQVPTPQPMTIAPKPADPLPQADYVVVTWTVEEAKALADTLTPGYPSKTAWYPYTHNFTTEYVPIIKKGAPSLTSKRLGSYFLTEIAGKRVLCIKSELHLSQDGAKMPVAKLWAQIIAEAQPKLILTTGTAGGIGSGIELGDVVSAASVRFDCLKAFKSQPFHNAIYPCTKLKYKSTAIAEQLFLANTAHLPVASRAPQIYTRKSTVTPVPDVVTTDFFAFDDSSNTYGLQGLGGAVEMGDAVLGLVISQMTTGAPKWGAIRNASDPQIDDTGLTVAQAANKAAQIYEKYGYWTTIPSAITCWSVILDN
jgi:nucleoside phosphorylase